jgi:hypothetical protein
MQIMKKNDNILAFPETVEAFVRQTPTLPRFLVFYLFPVMKKKACQLWDYRDDRELQSIE